MESLVYQAMAAGFTKAVWLNKLKIECESRLRAYCNPQACPGYGNNWVCPPACGSIEECAARVSRFESGILLQSVFKLEGSPSQDYIALNRCHNLRLRNFIESINNNNVNNNTNNNILALTSGGCIFCDSCAYPDPCCKPHVRMHSLSAYGIDVGKLCSAAGLEYSFRPDRIYYMALVLVR